MMYKVLPCPNHHSQVPMDCAPSTQSTRWVVVTPRIWRTWGLVPTLTRVVSVLQCLTILVWTNPRFTPQGLNNCFTQDLSSPNQSDWIAALLFSLASTEAAQQWAFSAHEADWSSRNDFIHRRLVHATKVQLLEVCLLIEIYYQKTGLFQN